jgi:hypothetical protein
MRNCSLFRPRPRKPPVDDIVDHLFRGLFLEATFKAKKSETDKELLQKKLRGL